jgi:hypothetical protein
VLEEIIAIRQKNTMFDLNDVELSQLIQHVYDCPIRINEEDVLERIKDRYRWPKFYNTECPTLERIAYRNGDKEQDFFSPFDDCVIYDEFLNFYQQGYTFVLSGVQYLFDDISRITEKLNSTFGVEINSNMYISKGKKAVSFPYHDHDYPVIVKNVQGKSLWTIDDNDYILEKQNVFYIEKNKWHCVKEIYETKISITFNLN